MLVRWGGRGGCKSLVRLSMVRQTCGQNMKIWGFSVERQAICVHTRYDDVIKWKHFPRYWPFVRGIHQWPVNSPHKCQWINLNKRLSKQSWGWWFETPARSSWRHCNELVGENRYLTTDKAVSLNQEYELNEYIVQDWLGSIWYDTVSIMELLGTNIIWPQT